MYQQGSIFEKQTTHSDAGIDIASVSWWGQASRASAADSQGVSTDCLVPTVLAAAEALASDPKTPRPIHIAFHLEPYPGRSAASVREDLAYIKAQYGGSSAFVPICECILSSVSLCRVCSVLINPKPAITPIQSLRLRLVPHLRLRLGDPSLARGRPNR